MAVSAALAVPTFAPAQDLTTVTVGEITRSGTSWARVVAIANGYFADEGIELDTLVIQGGPPAIAQQVIGGGLDIGVTNFDMVIRAVEGGAPLTIVGASMVKVPFSIVAAPEIETAQDLVGQTISVSSPRDVTAVFMNRWLAENGIALDEVDTIYVGATPERLAALINGAVKATTLTQPFDFRALDDGYVRLADFGLAPEPYAFLGLAVHNDWLAENEDIVRGYLTAMKRATDWLLDESNREEAIDILAADIGQERALVERMYDYYFGELHPFSEDLSISDAAVQSVLDAMVETGELTAPTPEISKYVDMSYLPE